MKPEEGNQLGQEVVLCEERLGLMGVERLEILLGYVGLLLSLLDVVLLEHCVLDEVRVGDVVEDGVTEHLLLFVAVRKAVSLFEGAMGQRLQEQVLICEFEVEDFLYRSADEQLQVLPDCGRVKLSQVDRLLVRNDSLCEEGWLFIELENVSEDSVSLLVGNLEESRRRRGVDRVPREVLEENVLNGVVH